MMLQTEDGKFLVELAREAIKTYLKDEKIIEVPVDTPKLLRESMGVFVTIHRKGQLRGCIGYPEPVKPLVNALIEISVSSATADPRFPPLSLDELDEVELEVSVLTKPELIEVKTPKGYLNQIKIGEDGLIVEKGVYRGLLLPQVAVEWCWDVEEFLANTCMKAGLSPDCWFDEKTKIYKFQALIFHEDVSD